jgi:hypothetical protein
MTTHTFLDDDWLARFNDDIRAEPRNVVALPDTRLAVRVPDAPGGRRTLVLDVQDERPIVLDGASATAGEVTAEIEVPHDLLRTMLVDGEMLAGLSACDTGEAVPDGRRETLLYFLYHLFPGGPEGAQRVAASVGSYTAP